MKKKIVSVFLSMVMSCGMFSVAPVYAEGVNTVSEQPIATAEADYTEPQESEIPTSDSLDETSEELATSTEIESTPSATPVVEESNNVEDETTFMSEPTENTEIIETGEENGGDTIIPEENIEPTPVAVSEEATVDSEFAEDSSSEAELILNALEGTSDNDTVTRIDWLQSLITLFDMSVEEDNYPDNYYTDIDSSSTYYRDVMVATEFGLVDVEAGEAIRLEDAATREFTAHSLNVCLGFQLETAEYTFADSSSTDYAVDLQIARQH